MDWELIGELQVSDVWQAFNNDVISDTFRITTTITDVVGWETERIRSGAYLRFIYPDPLLSKSRSIYIPVNDSPTIYELPIPKEFKDEGYVIRTPSVRLSSRWVGKINYQQGFAKWKLKLEALI
ncbi:hypothetical protein [Nostoc sp. TCL26-01]|uniref:hypothetical protein n=1 Tax=Nostoc sp. TCL26-01 TaxID=2576904 RepID=UPI0015BDB0BA|nr:hypothetical protein [Nostoc sp. TCL26-01]QLE54831.1 hypothetical protein FD725_04455 [Nostoc sp. TCL26-01]